MAHKSVHLIGGKPTYDLTILEPTRWGMNRASFMLRDTAHDGMNILHKLHERSDWWGPFKGRNHHASWCAQVTHPDMRLIESAPDLLAALQRLMGGTSDMEDALSAAAQARAAITKALGFEMKVEQR